jgi:hypothetical protein
MYNFYNSPELATKLKVEYFTDCMGPVRVNRQSTVCFERNERNKIEEERDYN